MFLVGVDEIMAGAPIHVDTTQLYLLRDGTLVTEGLAGTITVRRAVTGGTGRFAGAVGQVKQEVLGSNSTGLFNIRLTFTFRDR